MDGLALAGRFPAFVERVLSAVAFAASGRSEEALAAAVQAIDECSSSYEKGRVLAALVEEKLRLSADGPVMLAAIELVAMAVGNLGVDFARCLDEKFMRTMTKILKMVQSETVKAGLLTEMLLTEKRERIKKRKQGEKENTKKKKDEDRNARDEKENGRKKERGRRARVEVKKRQKLEARREETARDSLPLFLSLREGLHLSLFVSLPLRADDAEEISFERFAAIPCVC
ncbi:hypothetical protein TGFOU_216030A [Toxoplasma gondii FOU]|uniref:Uncharacterized protein n=2 Tax=Toxoplasma gondii TaxID=5811 RepID=A0A086K8T8_TOXGO|nr:hypothetical protein TGFOU_216030A [Toxoplasma gondii FOU]PUA84407.1 hypothetical protein TGBR9_216030 [Toxoplasma gondii TgCATBr9]